MLFQTNLERIFEFCRLLYEISRVPIQISDASGNTCFFCPHQSEFQDIQLKSAVLTELRKNSASQPTLHTFHSTLLYSFLPFPVDGQEYFLILGPALLCDPSLSAIKSIAPLFTCIDTHRLYAASKQIPVYSTAQFLRFAQMLYLTIFQEKIHLSEFLIANQELLSQDSIDRDLQANYFERQELTSMPVSFEYEQMFTECVKKGDTAELKKLLDTYISGSAGTLSSSPLRQAKDSCITIAALISRAAIAGGLRAENAFRLSDVYVQHMENCSELKDVYALCAKMVFDLTERVAQAQTQKAYSFPISQCIQYIDNHLHQELSLQTLAAELQLSTRYLSRLFKQETGVNLTAYIQQERIREAQNLLLFSDKSLSEISNFLCFVSQSYFIQIFKRYTGMTPQQFRRSNRRKSACTRNSS